MSPPAPQSPGISGSGGDFEASAGWCAHEVEQELSGLRLLVTEVQVAREGRLTGESPRDIKRRLRELSNRYRGAGGRLACGVKRLPAAYQDLLSPTSGSTRTWCERRSRPPCSSGCCAAASSPAACSRTSC